MSEPRRLSDAELLAQLRRRSSDEPAQSEQWRSDFIVGVGDKIDSAPSVTNRRLPAIAGLAAAVAILIVLVVAMPGISPGGASPSPAVGATSISAMDARDFAARLASGELGGDTVLINGRILPYDGPPLYGATCSVEREQPVQPNFTCTLGRLDGIDPAVYVEASYAATPPGDATLLPGSTYVWAAQQPPIEGVLALSVDEFRRVTFLGRDRDDPSTSSLSEVSALALESVTPNEVRVVSAWLTGIVAPVSCGPPEPGTYLADLPGRFCANPSWLSPDPRAVDPNGYTIPDDWLQVQSNAYLAFAPDPAGANGSAEPREGLYLIAKRLEGNGCPRDQPPCWQWEVVGRVTVNADGTHVEPARTPNATVPTAPTATPTSDSGFPSIDCSDQTGDSQWPTQATVHDLTGLIASCEAVKGSLEIPPVRIENPDEDLRHLRVAWEGGCNGRVDFTFAQALDGFELVGQGGSCILSVGVARAMLIHLREDVSAASVSMLWRPATTTSPAPTLAPTVPPVIEPQVIDCDGVAGNSSNGAAWMEDHTGKVRECVVGPIQPPDETSVRFDAEPPSVTLSWMTPCAADTNLTELQLWSRAARPPVEPWTPFDAPFLLTANRLPPTDSSAGCHTMINGREVTIYLNEAMSDDDLEWFVMNEGRGFGTVASPDHTFQLSLESDKPEYRANELIELEIGLLYEGPEAILRYDDHFAPRLHIEQLDGDLEMASTSVDYDCRADGPITLRSGERLALPFVKTIAYAENDPNADIYSTYWNDPQLRLPAGRYRLLIDTSFQPNGLCGDSRPGGFGIEASIIIEVR